MKNHGPFLLFIFYFLLTFTSDAAAATGCAYPSTLDSFANVSSGSILTAADYNKLQCTVENLEANFRLPNFTVATKPASPQIGRFIYITDAIDATTCNTGGGTAKNPCVYDGINWVVVVGSGGGGGGAPTGATYITRTSDATLAAEFALSSLPTGILKNTTGTGIPTIAIEGTDYYAPGGITAATVPFTPYVAGNLAATDLQAAVQELRDESFRQRTFQDQANVLTWTNADGLAGNPIARIANSFIDGSSRIAIDSGSSDDYAACPLSISTMSTPAYVDRSIHGFTANTSNSGAATINYCGLGSRPLVKLIGGVSTPLATGDILVSQPVLTIFNSAANNFKIISTLASTPSGAGTPAGPANSCQYNAAGAFGGDAGCTYDPATDVLATLGGYTAGNVASNWANIVQGGSLAGTWNYSANRNANMDLAGTTGTLPDGNGTKFNAAGLIVDGGPRYKTCIIENDMQSATPLANANITGRCDVDSAGILVEVAVFASSGTPSVLLERWRPNGGAVADLTTTALATAAAGAYACSKTTAVAGIAGITCTNTLQNTTINAGDVIRVKSATAGGTATWAHIKATVQW